MNDTWIEGNEKFCYENFDPAWSTTNKIKKGYRSNGMCTHPISACTFSKSLRPIEIIRDTLLGKKRCHVRCSAALNTYFEAPGRKQSSFSRIDKKVELCTNLVLFIDLADIVVRLLRLPDFRSTSTWMLAFWIVDLLKPRNLKLRSSSSLGGT